MGEPIHKVSMPLQRTEGCCKLLPSPCWPTRDFHDQRTHICLARGHHSLQFNDDRLLDCAVIDVQLEEVNSSPPQQPLHRQHGHVVGPHTLLAPVVETPTTFELDTLSVVRLRCGDSIGMDIHSILPAVGDHGLIDGVSKVSGRLHAPGDGALTGAVT